MMHKMKNVFLWSLGIFFSFAVMQGAEAVESTYIGVFGGPYFATDANSDYSDTTHHDLSWSMGHLVGAQLGYRLDHNWRLEGEFSYRRARIDKVKDRDTKVETGGKGELWGWTFMANGYYDWREEDWKWWPYFGGGIGFARVEYENTTNGFTKIDSSDEVFAFQAIVGGAYNFSENWEAFVEYRYFGTVQPKFQNEANVSMDLDVGSHSGILGLRYNF